MGNTLEALYVLPIPDGLRSGGKHVLLHWPGVCQGPAAGGPCDYLDISDQEYTPGGLICEIISLAHAGST